MIKFISVLFLILVFSCATITENKTSRSSKEIEEQYVHQVKDLLESKEVQTENINKLIFKLTEELKKNKDKNLKFKMLYYAAKLSFRIKKNKEALVFYKKALALNPNYYPLVIHYSYLLLNDKRYKKLLTFLKNYKQVKFFDEPEFYKKKQLLLLVAHYEQGEYSKLIKLGNKMFKMGIQELKVYEYMAKTYMEQKKFKEARYIIERALLYFGDDAELNFLMGEINFLAKRGNDKYWESIPYYLKAFKIDKAHKMAWSRILDYYLEVGMCSKGKELLNVELNNEANYMFQKARFYTCLKDYDNAKKTYKKILTLDKGHLESIYNLAALYLHQYGNKKSALHYFRRYIKYYKNSVNLPDRELIKNYIAILTNDKTHYKNEKKVKRKRRR